MTVEEKKIGAYRVEAELGRGAMGVVYRARHELTKRSVALKVLFENSAASVEGVERFRREVSVSALVEDPGIVAVYDAGEHESTYYYAMELLEGDELGETAPHRGLRERVELVQGVLDTLAACHAVGVVHRDLKPENIYVVECDGVETLKVLDFGVASISQAPRATQTGFALGTPVYMSPEQAMRPSEAGPPSDVWSIGVMLYEMVTDRLPFQGETPTATMINVVNATHDAIPPSAAPQGLIDVIEHCLEKDAADRFPDAAALKEALDDVLAMWPKREFLVPTREEQVQHTQAMNAPAPKPSLAPWFAAVVAAGIVVVTAGYWILNKSEEKTPIQLTAPVVVEIPTSVEPVAPPLAPIASRSVFAALQIGNVAATEQHGKNLEQPIAEREPAKRKAKPREATPEPATSEAVAAPAPIVEATPKPDPVEVKPKIVEPEPEAKPKVTTPKKVVKTPVKTKPKPRKTPPAKKKKAAEPEFFSF